ncbi:MAG: Ty1/Copia family ribonuclease HI [Gaiellaceae bacterium]
MIYNGHNNICGSTPIQWISKRQNAIETSTYGAEFKAMRTATEETIAYMLRSFDIPITKPTTMMDDNLGVIQNASNADGLLKETHCTVISQECHAAAIITPFHIPRANNHADTMTKVTPQSPFQYLMCGQQQENKLDRQGK